MPWSWQELACSQTSGTWGRGSRKFRNGKKPECSGNLARKGLCHWAQLESGAGAGWVGCGHRGSSLWGPTSHIWGPDQDHRLLQKSRRSAAWALCREKSPNFRVTATPSTADLGLVTLCGGILGAVGCTATSLPHLFTARSPPVVTTTDVPRRGWVKPFELK